MKYVVTFFIVLIANIVGHYIFKFLEERMG